MVSPMSSVPRVLLVDDEPEILASLRRTLRACKYEITCVNDPREAIELLSKQSFDMLVSDIDMPIVDGHAVMARARALQPGMIRVFLSGTGSMGAAVKAINEGEVYRFVPKPFDADELRRILKEALARKAELDIASQASARARRRHELHQELESEHPGITDIALDEAGVYVVDIVGLPEVGEGLLFAR